MPSDVEHGVACAPSQKRRRLNAEMSTWNNGPPRPAQNTFCDASISSVRLEATGCWGDPRVSTDSERSTLSADMESSVDEAPGSAYRRSVFSEESMRLEVTRCWLFTDSENGSRADALAAPLSLVERSTRVDEESLLAEMITGAVKEAAWRRRWSAEASRSGLEVREDVLSFCAVRMPTSSSSVCVIFGGE
jgi:hypothetical protein